MDSIGRLEAVSTAPLNGGKPSPSLADLLDALVAFLRRFSVMTEFQFHIVALWVVHSHAIEAADTTPFLAVMSPEKQSGKTRLLELLTLLCRGAWHTLFPTEAVLYRKIDAEKPTLLLDEVDAIFGSKSKDYEGLRSLLNSGNRKGTTVARCTGKGFTLQEFTVFSPRVLAGIGALPDTVADRSIPIRMVRRLRHEVIESFSGCHRREAEKTAQKLKTQVEAWANEVNLSRLRDAVPELPEALSDRQQDAAEPILAIADVAGGPWPDRARKALLALCTDAPVDEAPIGIRLLSDLRGVFDRAATDRLPSDEICKALVAIEAAPWTDWYGKPFSPRNLADRLRGYDIRPRTVRAEDTTKKGYHREQFEDAWARYLPLQGGAVPPETGCDPSHPSQLNGANGLSGLFDPSQDRGVTDVKSSANPPPEPLVTDVTDKTAQGQEVLEL